MKKNTKDKKLNLFYVISIVLITYTTVILVKQELKIRELEDKKLEAQKIVASLNKDIEELEGKVDKTNTVEYIETIAREELKMIKPNEVIYIDINKLNAKTFTD